MLILLRLELCNALSESMSCMRKHGAVAKNWNENILKDAKRRKK